MAPEPEAKSRSLSPNRCHCGSDIRASDALNGPVVVGLAVELEDESPAVAMAQLLGDHPRLELELVSACSWRRRGAARRSRAGRQGRRTRARAGGETPEAVRRTRAGSGPTPAGSVPHPPDRSHTRQWLLAELLAALCAEDQIVVDTAGLTSGGGLARAACGLVGVHPPRRRGAGRPPAVRRVGRGPLRR